MLANLILSFICVKKVKEMTEDRSWMYEGRVVNGKISVDWVNMVGQRFILFVLQHRECMSGEMIKCLCKLVKCQNKSFVLATQAVQVYFCTYPSKNRNRANWEAVCKVKARGNIDMPESSTADVIVPPF